MNLVTAAEIGAQTLRPNNSVFVVRINGFTAIYNADTGKWTKGPKFPMIGGQQIDTADAPSSLLTNGQVMLAASPGVYKSPATFYIFNGKKLDSIATPPNAVNDSSYNVRLLMLPTGQVLEADGSSDVEIYTGATIPYPGVAPTSVRCRPRSRPEARTRSAANDSTVSRRPTSTATTISKRRTTRWCAS